MIWTFWEMYGSNGLYQSGWSSPRTSSAVQEVRSGLAPAIGQLDSCDLERLGCNFVNINNLIGRFDIDKEAKKH